MNQAIRISYCLNPSHEPSHLIPFSCTILYVTRGHHHSGVCVEDGPNYECVCAQGYHFDGETCVDIDECREDPCGNGDCVNSAGSYTSVKLYLFIYILIVLRNSLSSFVIPYLFWRNFLRNSFFKLSTLNGIGLRCFIKPNKVSSVEYTKLIHLTFIQFMTVRWSWIIT